MPRCFWESKSKKYQKKRKYWNLWIPEFFVVTFFCGQSLKFSEWCKPGVIRCTMFLFLYNHCTYIRSFQSCTRIFIFTLFAFFFIHPICSFLINWKPWTLLQNHRCFWKSWSEKKQIQSIFSHFQPVTSHLRTFFLLFSQLFHAVLSPFPLSWVLE